MKKIKITLEGNQVNAIHMTEEEFNNFKAKYGLVNWERKELPSTALKEIGITAPNGFLFAKASGGDVPCLGYQNELLGIDIFRDGSESGFNYKVYHSYGEKTEEGFLVFHKLKKNKDHYVNSLDEFQKVHNN